MIQALERPGTNTPAYLSIFKFRRRKRFYDFKHLLVLGHAGGVLGEALRVDEAVELLPVGGQGDGDVLGVARHPHILNDV